MNDRRFYFAVIIPILLIIISALPVPLVVNAAKYAEVGREMLMNHDWINLTIGGDAYDQKPPMLFWIAAVTFKLFGLSIPAYKLAVLLFSFIGIYSTYRLAKLFYGKETGLLAAFFWITSLGFQHFNNDIHTDTLLANFVVFSVWQFSAYLKNHRWKNFLLGAVGVGLSMLAKGPVGVVIPAAAIGGSLLVHKQWKEIFNYRWLIALVIVGIMIVPAMAGLLNQFGLEGIKFYFWTNNVGRVTGSYHGSSTDYSFYLHTSLYVLLPWTIFMVYGFIQEIRSLIGLRKNKTTDFEVVNIFAVVVYLGILSVAKQQNPHYMLSAVPFMYIISAKWTVRLFSSADKSKARNTVAIINKVIAVIGALALMVIPIVVFPETRVWFWAVYLILFAGVIVMVVKKNDLPKQVMMLTFTVTIMLFTVNVNLLPNMLTFHTSIEAAEIFNEKAPDGATLNIYGEKARLWNLLLYSKAPGTYLIEQENLEAFLPKPGAWIYTTEDGYASMQELNLDMEVIKKFTGHKQLTSQSSRFLNPKTRASRFRTMYLVELK
ncbi:glycosyltransferase family 39 protein [Draconibacterium sp. IB214405]|uniref:ArnT family glycosyltransferase n=1 Tax=Draconibacterium sp. IB214405 TaxID=3097352 RepID=UPI002A1520B1|nr:glycosyltransferase family 39 protein [Draconibacterium sp. IB214405]MDX8338411.1 glycosyltransferase family 39 protein [Draconibacterium sp. IB214405]